ncbi:MAG TPA: hypothetical protein DD781_14265 [Leclercia adecarboxylata]|jgi:hypothetical protein|uniref:Uncharacterized protein n=1 Tax=Leclercia adecarboxylata TaxID=83655 RepID=A0A855ED26_9ENTR|nr:hypothetical protein CRX53_01675 [Leclercia adecarboxylata]RFS78398.1 hypothetical protein D0U00_13035 [Leclercia adecarboxylata]HAG03693.1 hypothetical protein [Leclercia adecarboxylata]HBQ67602.1 hypothetical protein [Leclercia adecarboxylata]HBU92596.1 hypothetical protein [Leclercia adecarboxylata]
MQICCQWIFGKRRHSGDLAGESQLKKWVLFVVFAPLMSWKVINGQKDQLNHVRKRLRLSFNSKCSSQAQKSGPFGQNSHF